MKTLITAVAVVAFASMAHAGNNNGPKGGNATAVAGAAASAHQLQGQAQGQLQGQSQSAYQGNKQSTSVNIDTPRFTYGVQALIGSTNNSPCGRTFFGIPASGDNCTARQEAAAIYNMLVPSVGEAKASRTAALHLCRMDKTMRDTLIAAGICELK